MRSRIQWIVPAALLVLAAVVLLWPEAAVGQSEGGSSTPLDNVGPYPIQITGSETADVPGPGRTFLRWLLFEQFAQLLVDLITALFDVIYNGILAAFAGGTTTAPA